MEKRRRRLYVRAPISPSSFFFYIPRLHFSGRGSTLRTHAKKNEPVSLARFLHKKECQRNKVLPLHLLLRFAEKETSRRNSKNIFLEKCKGINFCLSSFIPPPTSVPVWETGGACGRVKVGAGKPFFSFLQFLPHHSPSSPLEGVSSFISHILDVLRLKKPTVKKT